MRVCLALAVWIAAGSTPATSQEAISDLRRGAMRGDYQAQRNTAYCLRTGECGGVLISKPIEACAWRIVILSSGDRRVDRSDIANYRLECVSLITAQERAVAVQQADALFREIYGKPLPAGVAPD